MVNFLRLLLAGLSARGKRREIVTFESPVVVLGPGDNASISYFIDPHLRKLGLNPAYVSIDALPPADLKASRCDTVIIVRYLPHHWVAPLQLFRRTGGRIVYFMDDDLLDPAAHIGLPRKYLAKIRTLAVNRRKTLEEMCDEFWVGSVYLAEKYSALKPLVVDPQPSVAALTASPHTSVCYHGTASHQTEMAWLVPVMSALLGTSPKISFEIFGDHAVNRMFRDLPGVAVIHPMSWPNYLSFTAMVRRDIALAPLLPAAFNAGRGPTKFFDFARMGAVGIYSDVAPYRGFIRDKIDGLLLPNDPELWVKTIVDLAANPMLRQQMARAALDRALSLAWNASPSTRSIEPIVGESRVEGY